MKHPRWSFTNSIYDPSSKYRFNISHKISPDIEYITPTSLRAPKVHKGCDPQRGVTDRVSSAGGFQPPLPNSSGDHKSPSELPEKLVIGGQHVFNDDEYESVETYLYGLNEIHIRMIAKYYNIFYENSFITYLLDTNNIVNNAKNILFKWLYGNIDEYIYKYPTQTNNKQQHQYQKSIKNSHLSGLMPRIEVKSTFQPTNRILTTENPTMVVAVARQPNKLRSINESVPSDKITLSQRIYRIFSNMWRCFSIIIYFCWLITIRIFSG